MKNVMKIGSKIVKSGYALKAGFFSVALASAVMVPSASAAVIGSLSFTNCDGGAVSVSLNTIVFTPTVTPTSGCIVIGATTSITFAGGSIQDPPAPATPILGTINDLNLLTPGVGTTPFITFPGFSINLTALGPGSPNTSCPASFAATGPACSVNSTSPFTLIPENTFTLISLPFSGLAFDSAPGPGDPFSGGFTTQLSVIPGTTTPATPAAIQAAILAGNTITNTFSFGGNALAPAAVPEPVTMVLIGGGLMAFAGLKRKLKA
jgi:hypothetical protein